MADELKFTVKQSGGDYSSVEAALNANEQNLVTNDKWLHIEISGTWSVVGDATQINVHNYTTDADHYILIETIGDSRHAGYYDETKYQQKYSQGGSGMFIISSDYVTIDGIQINNTGGAGGTCIEMTNEPVTIKNSIFLGSGSVSQLVGINCDIVPTNSEINIINNIVYDCGKYGLIWDYANKTAGTCYNNTFYNCGHDNSQGALRIFGTAGDNDWYVINNIGNGNFIDMIIGNAEGTADNATEDTSSPNIEWRNTIVDFVDEGNDIFLLAATADVIDGGTNLSADSFFPFNYDILGTIRPSGSEWDIGVHEYVSTSVPLATNRFLSFEFKQSLVTNRLLPFEFTSSMFTNRQLPFELLLGFATNRQLPFSFRSLLATNRLLPFEFKQSIALDKELSFENLLHIDSDRQLFFESLIKMNTDRQLPFENNLGLNSNRFIPFDFGNTLNTNRSLPFESLLKSDAINRLLPFDFSEKKEINRLLPFEFKQSLEINRSLPFEFGGVVLLTFNFALPFEFKQSVNVNRVLPVEIKETLNSNRQLLFEFGNKLNTNRNLVFEILQSITLNKQLSFEFKSSITLNKNLAFEWRSLFGFNQQLPFDFISKLATNRLLPVEWRSLFGTNRNLAFEWRALLETNRQLPFENILSLKSIDKQLAFEILSSIQFNQLLPMDWLGIALAAATVIDIEMLIHYPKDIHLIYFDPKDIQIIIS